MTQSLEKLAKSYIIQDKPSSNGTSSAIHRISPQSRLLVWKSSTDEMRVSLVDSTQYQGRPLLKNSIVIC